MPSVRCGLENIADVAAKYFQIDYGTIESKKIIEACTNIKKLL
jgi:hypothetical protein